MGLKIKNSIEIRKDKEHIMLFDTEKELLHEINKIGYEIIKLCDGKNEKEEIQKSLMLKFKDVDRERIKQDVEEFIKDLENKNILEIIPKKITDKVYLYKPESGSFTYYINDDKKILIDAGVFVKEPVDLIIITHCHFDHILFLDEIKRINNCKIACGKKEKEAIEKLNEKVLLNYSIKKISPQKVDIVLKEGDIIKGKNFNLRVLETPGHTNGSISLFDQQKGILFSGDSWFGNDYQGKWVYPSGSEKESYKTLKKLKRLKIRILCPGHWNVVKI